MIRVVVFLAALCMLAVGIGWLADIPGDVALTLHGWKIETSATIALLVFTTVLTAAIFAWSLLRAIIRSPRAVRLRWQRRRGEQGYRAISRGLIAVGAGDIKAARKHAEDALRLMPGEPLALLLGAQSAQLQGDRIAAEQSFRIMAGRADTKVLGLRGLFVEAQRRNDLQTARLYAEEAAKIASASSWAAQALLQFQCADGDWAGALDLLARHRKEGAVDKDSYRRKRAVLLTARALSLEDSDRDEARACALEAVKLAPDLVPAVALAGRFLAEAGARRKAARMVEKAWRAGPHPDLADVYANLRLGGSARDRLSRIKALAAKAPAHREGALALARAAIEAREFATAREILTPLLAHPTRRVALLMAELEKAEHGDEGRAREWTARAFNAAPDPAWVADGLVSERWLPMSPVSGELDAFEWKTPLVAIGQADAGGMETTARAEMKALSSEPAGEKPAQAGPAAAATSAAARTASGPRKPRLPLAEAVIPVVHAPDDPGPEPDAEQDASPERAGPGGSWRDLLR